MEKEEIKEENHKVGEFMAWIIIILVIISIIVIIIYAKPKPQDLGIETMNCISERTELYIVKGCSHCKKQEEILNGYINNFNITDCFEKAENCANLRLLEVPTWIINNKTYSGVKTLEELKELTGC